MLDKTKQVEEYVAQKLAVLGAYGFSIPKTNRDKWSTTISSLSADISIEVELDWRELDVFFLLTALSDGHLPLGYYVSKGKKCRIHLENALKDVCGINAADIESAIRKQPARSKRDAATMKSRIDDYIQLVERHISTILERGIQLFE